MIGIQTRLGGVHVLSLMFSVVGLLGQASAAAQCGRQSLPGAPDPGTAGGVYSIVVLPDGDIIVGGRFESAGNLRATGFAKYHLATGNCSALGSATTGTVSELTLCPNGDVVAAGDFSEAGGLFTRGVARFSFVTGAWSVFEQDLIAGGSLGRIDKVIALPDGDLLVSGSFNRVGSTALQDIARYRPSMDRWSPIAAPPGTSVRWLQILSPGAGVPGGRAAGC